MRLESGTSGLAVFHLLIQNMKHLKLYTQLELASSDYLAKRDIAITGTNTYISGKSDETWLKTYCNEAKDAYLHFKALSKKWAKTSHDRVPERVERIYIEATDIATEAARIGKWYSGKTTYAVKWSDKASAYTSTFVGGKYSNSCRYKKTDAIHTVVLDYNNAEHLVNNTKLREMSKQDGLYLISLGEDGKAVWVYLNNKKIVSQSGWVIGDEVCCYHSTKSREHALAGFTKKRNIITEKRNAIINERKAERRYRLIARLCCNAKATIQDAKSLGFCDPGINAFRLQHNIGETATLPELVKTKNPSAIMLALHLARKLALAK